MCIYIYECILCDARTGEDSDSVRNDSRLPAGCLVINVYVLPLYKIRGGYERDKYVVILAMIENRRKNLFSTVV